VVVGPDVNNAVITDYSILNLFAAPKRSLYIGLGAVNVLTLDEFKGSMAHEFGHFSQKSLRLGTYVYLATRIIGEIVYGRDFWDRWVDRMRDAENGLFVLIGNFFYWPAWVLRKGLQGIYYLIHSVHAAMRRQMEFNADLVAVGLVGSDSRAHCWLRMGFGNDAFQQAIIDLRAAAQHHHYTWDFYHHHTAAMAYLRKVRRKPKAGIPPPLPADPEETNWIFDPKEAPIEEIWADHPPDHARERNVKRHYIRSVIDERSPWLLFQNADQLKTQITKKLNEEFLNYKKKFPMVEPAIVQEFIDAEHAETTYDPKYQGMYDNRIVDPGILSELVQVAAHASPKPKDIYEALVAVYPANLVKKMDKYFRHDGGMRMLQELRSGSLVLKGRTFNFRKKKYRLVDVPKLIKKVAKDIDDDHEFLKSMDRDVFLVHCRMARQLGEARAQTLVERYRFHLAVQEIIREWNKQQDLVENILVYLSDKEKLSNEVFHAVTDDLSAASDSLREGLRKASELYLPALSNMDEGKRLDLFLVEGKLVKHFDARRRSDSFSSEWIIDFLRQLHTILERLKRVHFKSLGVILGLQEQIAKDWCRTQNLALPQVKDTKAEQPQEVLEVVEVVEAAPTRR
jgi:Zn-dependent protease with chaperone function